MNKTILLTAFMFSMILFSCQPSLKIKDGQTAFKTKRYLQAADLFQADMSGMKSDFEKGKLAFRIAESYRLANKIVDASNWYKKSLAFGYDEPETIWNYALMLQQQERYAEAKQQFAIYANQYSFERGIANTYSRACDDAIAWKEVPEPIEVINLEGVNSASSDFAPRVYNDQLVFSSGTNGIQW